MEWSLVGLLALLLICPVAMMLMMRGGHGHGAADQTPRDGHLRHMSDEQLHEIARRADQELAERSDKRSPLGRDVGAD